MPSKVPGTHSTAPPETLVSQPPRPLVRSTEDTLEPLPCSAGQDRGSLSEEQPSTLTRSKELNAGTLWWSFLAAGERRWSYRTFSLPNRFSSNEPLLTTSFGARTTTPRRETASSGLRTGRANVAGQPAGGNAVLATPTARRLAPGGTSPPAATRSILNPPLLPDGRLRATASPIPTAAARDSFRAIPHAALPTPG